MTAADFLHWWRTQISDLVPAVLRGTWQNAKTTLALKIDGSQLELSASQAARPVTCELPSTDEAPRPAQVSEFLAGLPGLPQRVRLTLAPEEYLLRHLTLPRAAQAHLAEAVGFQLPQLTPFAADQLLYACGEMPDSPSSGPLSVWLVAIPRRRIGRALALIDQTPPENPLPLRSPPAPGGNIELAWRVRSQTATPRRHMRLAWSALVALWLTVFGVHIYQQRQEQAALDEKLMDLRARAAEVVQLRARLADATAQAAWLAGRRQSTASPLMLLDTLTQQLDDQTWLQALDLQGRRLTLRGISSSAASLIETLEANPFLKDVRFDAAITRDNRGQGDRFNISATLEPPLQDGDT